MAQYRITSRSETEIGHDNEVWKWNELTRKWDRIGIVSDDEIILSLLKGDEVYTGRIENGRMLNGAMVVSYLKTIPNSNDWDNLNNLPEIYG